MTNRKVYSVWMVPTVGAPLDSGEKFMTLSKAVKYGQQLIGMGAKAAIVYYGEQARQLLVHRPTDYVHLERL